MKTVLRREAHGERRFYGTPALLILLAILPGCFAVTELDVEWIFNTSDVFADKLFGAGHYSGPTVWDIDGDGVNEVVFGTRRGDSERMWCIDDQGSFEWLYPPIDEEGLPNDPMSKVSLVDLNRDGVYELCFAGRGGVLHVLNGSGHLEWKWDNPHDSNMIGSPQAYDIDGDGLMEFFMGDNRGFVYRIDNTGKVVWKSQAASDALYGQPTICDLEGDQEYELVFCPYHGKIHCLEAESGDLKWVFNESNCNPPVIVADVNRDDRYEIVASVEYQKEEPGNGDPDKDWSGGVICINNSGHQIWRWKYPYQIRMCQAMGDVDGDGSMDMAVMASQSVFCVDIGGSSPEEKWEVNFTRLSEEGILPPGSISSLWTAYQLIADIDGDGQQEILWLSPYPIVTDGSSGQVESYYTNPHVALNRRQDNGGWWGDVDQDGVSEWIVELNGNSHPETQVYCLTMNGSFPAQSPWPEYHHCAYPAEYQAQHDWITLKSAGSNSLWFPLELEIGMVMVIQITLILVGKKFL